ncbi:hypothetical protein [Candidatus Neptunichlamydia sp. REUL1]|uniref:hypothetical protein n=1 Tax=Candidatus Neptunichlamydia sp. REUL1 TaxID=3064277 RepID=UPI00292F322B|nr:hypothetical protein [Candidatus Neptunochlamydia sp. REUL1]
MENIRSANTNSGDPISSAKKTTAGVKLGELIPGTLGQCIAAFLKLQEDFVKIANQYGDQFQLQSKVTSSLAQVTANAQIQQGVDQFNTALCQGISQSVGGAVSMAANSFSFYKSTAVSPEENHCKLEIEGGKNYLNKLSRAPEVRVDEVEPGLDKLEPLGGDSEGDKVRKELLNKKTFVKEEKGKPPEAGMPSTDEEPHINNMKEKEFEKMQQKFSDHIKEKQAELLHIRQSKAQYLTALSGISESLSKASSGIGQAASATPQKKYGEDQADATNGQGAMQMAQGTLQQLQGSSTKFIQSASEINQALIAINNADMLS